MGIQALAMLFQFASFGSWGITACLTAGVLVVLVWLCRRPGAPGGPVAAD